MVAAGKPSLKSAGGPGNHQTLGKHGLPNRLEKPCDCISISALSESWERKPVCGKRMTKPARRAILCAEYAILGQTRPELCFLQPPVCHSSPFITRVVFCICHPYYVVPESLPLLLPEGLTEALDVLVHLLGVAAQELPDVLQAPQAVRRRRADLGQARVHLHGPGDAQDAVALLPVVVEGLLEQDGDRHWSREPGTQQDLPVLDPDLL